MNVSLADCTPFCEDGSFEKSATETRRSDFMPAGGRRSPERLVDFLGKNYVRTSVIQGWVKPYDLHDRFVCYWLPYP